MTEIHIEFNSDGGIFLEGLLSEGTGNRGVVITHPHPLYGGDMRNIVVETIYQAYRKHNYTTLRFNFRGVGGSSGRHDDGKGEQEDIIAAFNLLKEKGIGKIDLAGYSFGSWVIAQMSGSVAAENVMMVSPPAAMMPFNPPDPIPNLKLVITGSHDDYAPPGLIGQLVNTWNPVAAFEIIDGADHFFFGHTDKLSKIIQDII